MVLPAESGGSTRGLSGRASTLLGVTPEPYETVVAVDGTPVGSDTAFSATPDFISVYASLDCWIAPTSAATGVAGDGTPWRRIYVAATERRTIPWNGRGFWVRNATAAQLPVVRTEAWL